MRAKTFRVEVGVVLVVLCRLQHGSTSLETPSSRVQVELETLCVQVLVSCRRSRRVLVEVLGCRQHRRCARQVEVQVVVELWLVMACVERASLIVFVVGSRCERRRQVL